MYKILQALEIILRFLSELLTTLNLLIFLKVLDIIIFVSSNFVLPAYPFCSKFHMYNLSSKHGLFRSVWRPKQVFGCYYEMIF